MTKLVEQISIAIVTALCKNSINPEEVAEAAADVAKRYIEKAWNDRMRKHFDSVEDDVEGFQEWSAENGVTEQPGIVVSNGTTSTE